MYCLELSTLLIVSILELLFFINCAESDGIISLTLFDNLHEKKKEDTV